MAELPGAADAAVALSVADTSADIVAEHMRAIPRTRERALIIVLANPKGGVGKSTSAVNLAYGLSRRGRTLLIDADIQADSYGWYAAMIDSEDPTKILFRVHRQVDPKVFRVELAQFAQEFDYIVVDTPGKASPLVGQAIFLADIVLITTVPGGTELKNIPEAINFMDSVNEMRETAGRGRADVKVMLIRLDYRTGVANKARERLAENKLDGGKTILDLTMRAEVPQRIHILDGYGKVPRLEDYADCISELLGEDLTGAAFTDEELQLGAGAGEPSAAVPSQAAGESTPARSRA